MNNNNDDRDPKTSNGFLTVDDLAGWLQVPKATIYRWRSRPCPIPALKVGKYLRFTIEEVLKWIGRHQDSTCSCPLAPDRRK